MRNKPRIEYESALTHVCIESTSFLVQKKFKIADSFILRNKEDRGAKKALTVFVSIDVPSEINRIRHYLGSTQMMKYARLENWLLNSE